MKCAGTKDSSGNFHVIVEFLRKLCHGDNPRGKIYQNIYFQGLYAIINLIGVTQLNAEKQPMKKVKNYQKKSPWGTGL